MQYLFIDKLFIVKHYIIVKFEFPFPNSICRLQSENWRNIASAVVIAERSWIRDDEKEWMIDWLLK